MKRLMILICFMEVLFAMDGDPLFLRIDEQESMRVFGVKLTPVANKNIFSSLSSTITLDIDARAKAALVECSKHALEYLRKRLEVYPISISEEHTTIKELESYVKKNIEGNITTQSLIATMILYECKFFVKENDTLILIGKLSDHSLVTEEQFPKLVRNIMFRSYV